ncbi:MAG: aminoacyl-histidine dipeptidase [Eubacteriales bacterium]|jgi:dipeptidase D
MNQGLQGLEPHKVYHYFSQLCAIPHGSGNTAGVAEYCLQVAREHGLEHHQDPAGNVILIREASAGYEQAQPVILQGHLDMVCAKKEGCSIDFAKDGLDVRHDGEWVYAEGTSLGGDDGIAVAMALAVLTDPSIPAPRLEAIFTVDEEIGLLGAHALDVSPVRGRRLINLDSEAEGIFTVSCAGGVRANLTIPVKREPAEGQNGCLKISGLLGGHSGTEIHKGRGNANHLLGRVLHRLERCGGIRLVQGAGGMQDNAIPRESQVELVASEWDKACAAAQEMEIILRRELRVTDPEVRVTLEACEPCGLQPLDQDSTRRVITLLQAAPDGVQRMSPDIEGLVQTSLNMGIFRLEEGQARTSAALRSSVDSQKEWLEEQLERLAQALGGRMELVGDYPGWEYRPDSPLRELMVRVFEKQYGHAPVIEAIHAGLECGLLASKLPGLDCVSIGPDMEDIHTAEERLSIASTQRVWDFLLEVLAQSNTI